MLGPQEAVRLASAFAKVATLRARRCVASHFSSAGVRSKAVVTAENEEEEVRLSLLSKGTAKSSVRCSRRKASSASSSLQPAEKPGKAQARAAFVLSLSLHPPVLRYFTKGLTKEIHSSLGKHVTEWRNRSPAAGELESQDSVAERGENQRSPRETQGAAVGGEALPPAPLAKGLGT
jgi:hypothetical protein